MDGSSGAWPTLGVGIGWRDEIDVVVEQLPGVEWVEVVAENISPDRLPPSIRLLRARGLPVVPHGVALGLGGAGLPDKARLDRLARLAGALDAPLVTEHLAFVRSGGTEAGHLLPVPRSREALGVIAENVRVAQRELPVPLALENIAPHFAWPEDELTEAQFLAELADRTGVGLLVDVANLYTGQVNLGVDAAAEIAALPVEAIAYAHVAGGRLIDGVWHDTHTHPLSPPVLELLAELCGRARPPGVLLERDGNYPPPRALSAELEAIRQVLRGDETGCRTARPV
ncbi:DUF692 domain-containing protein [Streptomyces albireticuli]|uniref:Endonuclease n=1 Tax=Streptomyces albireticuli TaxID=1940 RepID=A0A2A2DC03_9ACTN|nr:DUF692 domain-containing protein [Streptomyces albireticuli]PAU50008.1 endonuclease [Streptomyces albireticuli]